MGDSFLEVKASVPIALHPSRLGVLMDGVEEQLNQYIMNYVDVLGGVVVLYREVKVKDKVGRIMQDRPHISFSAQAKFLVFAPKVGDFLVGEVTKVSHDHIAVLVCGVFFVTIGKDVIPDECAFDFKSDRWRNSSAKDGSRDINVGGFVRFQVVRVANNDGFFTVNGSLAVKDSGPVTALKHLQLTLPRSLKEIGVSSSLSLGADEEADGYTDNSYLNDAAGAALGADTGNFGFPEEADGSAATEERKKAPAAGAGAAGAAKAKGGGKLTKSQKKIAKKAEKAAEKSQNKKKRKAAKLASDPGTAGSAESAGGEDDEVREPPKKIQKTK